jgi:hypothetical protein
VEAGKVIKCSYKPMFTPFKTTFTTHPRVFRVEKKCVCVSKILALKFDNFPFIFLFVNFDFSFKKSRVMYVWLALPAGAHGPQN